MVIPAPREGAHAERDVNLSGTYVAGRDVTVVQQRAPARAASHALPRSTPDFVGRVEQVALLDELLSTDPAPLVVLYNGPGCGKSALALHGAYRAAAHRFAQAQLFVQLGGEKVPDVDPGDALRRLLVQLGLGAEEIPQELDDRVALYRSSLPVGSLVVLDNAMSAPQVEPLLPTGPDRAVIITSRYALTELEGSRRMEVGKLPDDEAYELLARKLGPERAGRDTAAVREIAALCGALPLALQIVGALLETPAYRRMPLSGFVERLRDEKSRLDLLSGEHKAVRASFALSYRALSPTAALHFCRLGLLRVPDVGDELAVAAGGTYETLGELLNAHLLEPVGEDRVRFHDLMRLFAGECAEQELSAEDRAAALGRAFDWCLGRAEEWSRAIGPEGTQAADDETYGAALDGFEAERAVFLGMIRQAAQEGRPDVPWRLTALMSGFFEVRGYWTDWLDAARLAEAAAHDEAPALGAALHQLGYVLRLLRRTSEALEAEVNALRLLRGESAQADVLGQLGIIYRELHRYDEAVRCLDEAAGLYRERGDRHGEGMVLRTLGHVHFWRRDLRAAQETLERAIELLVAVGDRATEAWSRANLLSVLGADWRDGEAKEQFTKARDIFAAIGHRQGEAWAYNHMGRIHRQYGRITEAVECNGRALETFRVLEDQYGIGWAALHLGIAQGDDALVREALAVFAAIDEEDGQGWALLHLAAGEPEAVERALRHFQTIGSLQGQGAAYLLLGDLTGDRQAYEKALEFLRAAHDPYRTALAQRGLGRLDGDQELIGRAQATLDRLHASEG
jgi:tetratricopeptide (TPR) repeat protein